MAKLAHAEGTLEKHTVLVREQGQVDRLQSKGSYGVRVEEGLALDLLEAAYLVEADRLVVTRPGDAGEIPLEDLLALGSTQLDRFETEHLAYRDMRSRGYVIRRREDQAMDAFQRGTAPPQQSPSMLVAARAESEPATPASLAELIADARGLGRKLLLSVVDEESDVTYYDVDEAHISGQLPDPAPELAQDACALLLDDRALLTHDPGLRAAGYGHTAGDQVYLSLAEAHHLAEHGLELDLPGGGSAGSEVVRERAVRARKGAEHALAAYTWLRERDLVPKTGFKFGVHYRVYKQDPGESHAPFLVQALPPDAAWTLRDVARYVRLTHSVRKQPVLWSPSGSLMIEWTRP